MTVDRNKPDARKLAAEQDVPQAMRRKHAEAWLDANHAALESSNAYVGSNGLPLARFRQF
jgi:post-segregation antitoxin (ccd killing protein)